MNSSTGFQPPHFSWSPCDETEGGGRKLKALCVCVCVTCVIHVSCLELTASLPLCEILSGCGLVCSWSVLYRNISSLSGFRSLSWVFLHLCRWNVSGGLSPSLDCVSGVCWQGVFCLLSTCSLSPVGMESVCVLPKLDFLWCHHVQIIRGVDKSGLYTSLQLIIIHNYGLISLKSINCWFVCLITKSPKWNLQYLCPTKSPNYPNSEITKVIIKIISCQLIFCQSSNGFSCTYRQYTVSKHDLHVFYAKILI